jgi:hypothetical protein
MGQSHLPFVWVVWAFVEHRQTQCGAGEYQISWCFILCYLKRKILIILTFFSSKTAELFALARSPSSEPARISELSTAKKSLSKEQSLIDILSIPDFRA